MKNEMWASEWVGLGLFVHVNFVVYAFLFLLCDKLFLPTLLPRVMSLTKPYSLSQIKSHPSLQFP